MHDGGKGGEPFNHPGKVIEPAFLGDKEEQTLVGFNHEKACKAHQAAVKRELNHSVAVVLLLEQD